MSFIVKGAAAPKTCMECPLADVEQGWCASEMVTIIDFDERPVECPLVPLPDKHGRLIDENEVRTEMTWLLTQPQRPTWNDTYHAIQEMDAVVEAEGEE